MDFLFSSDAWLAYLSLAAMEIVLGIDNIVFISILVARVPPADRARVRTIGIALALVSRLGLLFSLNWLMGLTEPIFTLLGRAFSARDLILVIGGAFLVGKATNEIHSKLESGTEMPGREGPKTKKKSGRTLAVLVQILFIDVIFSLDSVITAVGMAQSLPVMVAAMVTAVLVMLVSARTIGDFVERHPTVKMLALSFLVLIGVMLVAEGTGHHIEKGYLYFAMSFSLMVEFLNMRYRRKNKPLKLYDPGNEP